MKSGPWVVTAFISVIAWACIDFDTDRVEFCDGNVVCDAGVDAGPQSNYVFVTSEKVAPGGLGSVSAADAICQGLATKAGLRGTYRAWLPASNTVTALSRLNGARGWIRPDGRASIDQVTDNGDTGKALHPPILTEQGATLPPGEYVFTGTTKDGDASPNNCGFWTNNADDAGVAFGTPYAVWSSGWTDASSTGLPCNARHHLYCFGIDSKAPLKIAQPIAARRAFVTSARYAIGAGLGGADDLCRNEALAANLSGSYLAFLTPTSRSASSRFDAGGPTWYRTDDIPIAANAGELLGAGPGWVPLAALNVTADGGAYISAGVWTGAEWPSKVITDGQYTCADWTSATHNGVSGYTSWLYLYFYNDRSACGGGYHLYCLQQ